MIEKARLKHISGLANRNELHSALFHHSPIGTAIINLEGRIIETNAALQSFLGYTEKELQELTFRDVTHPNDIGADNTMFEALVKGEIDHYKLEKRYYHKNGEIKWGNLYVLLLHSEKEKNRYLCGMVQDITEEKKSLDEISKLNQMLAKKTQKIAALHCVADFGYYETDLINNQWTGNDDFYRIFGFDKVREPFRQEDFQAIVHPDDLTEVMKVFSTCLASEKPFNYEYRCVHQKTGQIIHVNSYSLAEYKNGQPVSLFGIKHDVTKTKQLNQQLQDANKKLEEFAYVISHDLKEPVRGVAGMLSLLDKKASERLSEQEKEYIQLAISSSRRMNKMIEGLLDYSRTGNINEGYDNVSIFKLIKEATAGLSESIEVTKANIVYPDQDVIITGYPNLLSRLLQNLISNAIKYKSNLAPQIKILIHDNETHFEIVVRDNGIGISSENHEKIFTLFNRVNPDRDDNCNGIGLAICKNIASLHQGTIKVISEIGKGSEFKITIAKSLFNK